MSAREIYVRARPSVSQKRSYKFTFTFTFTLQGKSNSWPLNILRERYTLPAQYMLTGGHNDIPDTYF